MIAMMNPLPGVFEVIPLLNNGAAVTDASTPLIVSNGSAEQEDGGNDASPRAESSRYFEYKSDALFLGVLAGFFIQFSTLVANFVILHNWGDDILGKAGIDFVCFSLVWSFFTSTMSILVLVCLRNAVSTTYTISLRCESSKINKERVVDELILLLECLFVVGALIGVCVAWTATDLLIGGCSLG
jgi:hypothetical protein